MRKAATSTEEKNLFKFMVNSVFGRSCMNIRKHTDVKIVTNERQANRLVSKPNYSRFSRINEDLVAVKMNKTKIYWNKPTYLGFSILEISKTLMYDYHYDVVKTQYGNRAKLLMTDTDSLLYVIETPDLYADMARDRQIYDTSDYPKDHPLYSAENCKVVGKFKDECAGRPAVEFVGLRSKMYSVLLSEDGATKRTAKGIKKGFVERHIKHDDYLECLRKERTSTATFKSIVSVNHCISTKDVVKTSLSPYDDKRWLIAGSTDTFAFGHFRCPR